MRGVMPRTSMLCKRSINRFFASARGRGHSRGTSAFQACGEHRRICLMLEIRAGVAPTLASDRARHLAELLVGVHFAPQAQIAEACGRDERHCVFTLALIAEAQRDIAR